MYDAPAYAEDFHLAQECLEGKASSLTYFQREFCTKALSFLVRAGASLNEATEVIGDLAADCIASDGRPPALSRYNGTCALNTWLNRMALNKLLTRKRREQRWQKLMPERVAHSEVEEEGENRKVSTVATAPDDEEPESAPVLEIVRAAVESAFSQCDAEDFVLLQLLHCDRLKFEELAAMFRCDDKTIRRRLERVEAAIKAATRAQIKARDPWLELKWEDFVEICRTATPACFRME